MRRTGQHSLSAILLALLPQLTAAQGFEGVIQQRSILVMPAILGQLAGGLGEKPNPATVFAIPPEQLLTQAGAPAMGGAMNGGTALVLPTNELICNHAGTVDCWTLFFLDCLRMADVARERAAAGTAIVTDTDP